MPSLFKKVREVTELVGVPLTLGSAAATALEVFVPHQLTSSHTLFAWQATGAIAGAVIGYLRNSFALLGKGRPVCLRSSARSLWKGAAAYLAFVIVPLIVVSPAVVERFPSLRGVRELLLIDDLVLNIIEAFGAFLAAYFFAGAIVALSPGLCNPRARLYDGKEDE